MKRSSFETIVTALNEAETRFLVVGGLAVNAHGFLRFTNDVDLVIKLTPDQIIPAFIALEKIGYFPAVPISAEQFADPALRDSWIREKGMLVLKFWSDLHRETPLDVFVYEPFDFEKEMACAYRPTDLSVPKIAFIDIPGLIKMKREANRPQDLIDIEKLEQLAEFRREGNEP